MICQVVDPTRIEKREHTHTLDLSTVAGVSCSGTKTGLPRNLKKTVTIAKAKQEVASKAGSGERSS